MEQPTKSDSFIELYEQGLEGKNIGIYTPYKRINGYTHGQIPGRYWLLGAESGAGKTTMADEILLNAIRYCIQAGIGCSVFYYSFEISVTEKKARWVSKYLFDTQGIILPSDYILSRIKGMPVTPDHNLLIRKAYADMAPIFEKITFIEDPVHPTFIFESLVTHHYGSIGTVNRPETKSKEGETKKGRILGYKPKDPNHQTFLVIDHLALLGHEAGLTSKGLMDRMSSYAVTMKNIFKTHILFIQQFSTDLMSTQRTMKKGDGFITPQRLDFGDTKYTFRDADVVMGLVQPKLYDIDIYRGYSVADLGDNFIAAYLMKNRYGPQGKWFPMWLNGMAGHFEHIESTPENLFEMQKFYDKTAKFKEICQLYSQPND